MGLGFGLCVPEQLVGLQQKQRADRRLDSEQQQQWAEHASEHSPVASPKVCSQLEPRELSGRLTGRFAS